jgi:hypothetical protein
MTADRRPTFETTLFVLAFVLALVFRFYNLGAAPLTDQEAGWALQALQVAHSDQSSSTLSIGPNPGYVFLTAALFMIFNPSNFLARFWPAIAGAMLVFAPIFFRRDLGRIPALILAFGLAVTSGLVVVSRQAASPMMALGFGLLGLGLLRIHRSIASGVLLGLALTCGPTVIHGALALGLSALLYRFLNRAAHVEAAHISESATTERLDLRLVFAGAATAIILVCTLFFLYPPGLTAWFAQVPAYLQGWVFYSGVSPQTLLIALLVYQPFAVIFSLVAAGRWIVRRVTGNHITEPLFLPLVLWALFSLGLALIYPNRQVSDLVWTVVPLWALAALELQKYLPQERLHPLSLVQAGLLFILGALFWITLIATQQVAPPTGLPWMGVRSAILGGILALGALTTVLVALGWSWEVSRSGLILGVVATFAVYGLGTMWGAAQLRQNDPRELWQSPPGAGDAGLFLVTLRELSDWSTGFSQQVDVVSLVDTPSLRWALRDYPKARFTVAPPAGELPTIVITRQGQEIPALTASYRGQDFAWWVWPGWTGVLPQDKVAWLTFRQAPLGRDQIILWARSDIFPGATSDSSTE